MRNQFGVVGLLLGILQGFCALAGAQPAPVKLLEVPSKEARDKVLALVKDIHKKDYFETKGDKLSAFATTLLREGRETRDDAAARFVLFAEALALASKANDWTLALAAVDQMGAEFKIDVLEQKSRALREMGDRISTPAKQLELLTVLGELAQTAIAADRYEVAAELGATAAVVARGCGSEVNGQVKERNETIAKLKAAFAGMDKTLAVLEKNPTDPQPNLAYGTFYGLVKGDWDRGLSGLALGSDPALKEVATTDLRRPTQPEQQLALADAWWTISEQRTPAHEKQNAQQRAGVWYKQALPSLIGLNKVRVEKRMAEMPASSSTGVAGAIRMTPHVGLATSVTNSIGMKFVYVPPGEFDMGSPASETGRQGDETQHRVILTRGVYLGTTEVTQGQWTTVMGTQPWKSQKFMKQGANYAASFVSWNDAQEFVKKLSAKEGRTYRLPTEAEWEYACRAGSQTAYSFGNDAGRLGEYAWIPGNAFDIGEKYAHDVAQKKPNAFGLYDMHGNVWEWCEDWYGDYAGSAVDPVGASPGVKRVDRGGGWSSPPLEGRSATRSGGTPETRFKALGFRVALSP